MRDPKRLSDKLGNLQPASVSNWNCDTGRREQDRSVQDMHMLVKAKEGSESVYKDLKDSEEFTCGMDDNVEQDKLSDVSLPYMDFLENIRF